MTTVDELMEFVRARLDEDRRAAEHARWAMQDEWFTTADDKVDEFVQRMSPARVLRDVHATRRIVDEHHPIDPCDAHDELMRSVPCPTLRLVASRWDDHPDYRDEWRPE